MTELDYKLNAVVTSMLEEGMDLRGAEVVFRRALLSQALKRDGNNQCALAHRAGVHRNTVSRAMKELGVAVVGKKKVRSLQDDVASTCEQQKTA